MSTVQLAFTQLVAQLAFTQLIAQLAFTHLDQGHIYHMKLNKYVGVVDNFPAVMF